MRWSIGSDIQTATGKTGRAGGTAITVPVKEVGMPQGLSLGFYRIEVTKDGEDIPAKYNTETTLSVAILREIEGAVFNLVY